MIVVDKRAIETIMMDKGITKYHLLKKYKLAHVTFCSIMDSSPVVSMKSIGILCDALECQPSDILVKVKE